MKGASTVTEGLGLVLEEPAPHWVILDLMLPDGDGADVLRHIRDQELAVRVAVTTGMNDSARLEFIRSLSPDFVFAKPINLGDLMKSLVFEDA